MEEKERKILRKRKYIIFNRLDSPGVGGTGVGALVGRGVRPGVGPGVGPGEFVEEDVMAMVTVALLVAPEVSAMVYVKESVAVAPFWR